MRTKVRRIISAELARTQRSPKLASHPQQNHTLTVAKHLKKILLILLAIAHINCSSQEEVVNYYPYEQFDNSLEIIDLDQTNLNFKEITDKSCDEWGKNLFIVIQFRDDNKIKRIAPFCIGAGLYKRRNVLEFVSETANQFNQVSIYQLENELELFYLNNGENENYSVSPEKALLEVSLDSLDSAKDLKFVLAKITRKFDGIKSTGKELKLGLFFNYYERPTIPPLPEESRN